MPQKLVHCIQIAYLCPEVFSEEKLKQLQHMTMIAPVIGTHQVAALVYTQVWSTGPCYEL